MTSFDIKSLFTNIILDETVAIATESFFNSPNQPRKFTKKFFSELLTSAVKDVIFLFNGKTYLQIDGAEPTSSICFAEKCLRDT